MEQTTESTSPVIGALYKSIKITLSRLESISDCIRIPSPVLVPNAFSADDHIVDVNAPLDSRFIPTFIPPSHIVKKGEKIHTASHLSGWYAISDGGPSKFSNSSKMALWTPSHHISNTPSSESLVSANLKRYSMMFSIEYIELEGREKSHEKQSHQKRTVVILPPTRGVTPIERSYAKKLSKKGFDVLILKDWNKRELDPLDLGVHQIYNQSAIDAFGLLTQDIPGPISDTR